MGVIVGVFLVIPLAALPGESRTVIKLTIVIVCIVAFASLVSISLRATNLEMMLVTAAYAAVIAVFLSSSS